MSRKEHHVVPNKNGGWDIKKRAVKENVGAFSTVSIDNDTQLLSFLILDIKKEPVISLLDTTLS